MADMVSALDSKDETDGDNGVDTSTGGDETTDMDEQNGVDPLTNGDGTIDDCRTDGSDDTDGSIEGGMLSGVEL
jgi:hypothetical protein